MSKTNDSREYPWVSGLKSTDTHVLILVVAAGEAEQREARRDSVYARYQQVQPLYSCSERALEFDSAKMQAARTLLSKFTTSPKGMSSQQGSPAAAGMLGPGCSLTEHITHDSCHAQMYLTSLFIQSGSQTVMGAPPAALGLLLGQRPPP